MFVEFQKILSFQHCRHVQVNNKSAIEFYKQFDFEIVETKQHYYKRIEPADAYVLQKDLKKSRSSTNNSLSAAINAVSISCGGQTANGLDSNHLQSQQQQASHGGKTKA